MDIVTLLISLLSGVIGANAAGAAAPEKSLGALFNSIVGLLGGALGGYLAQVLGLLAPAGIAVNSTAQVFQSTSLDLGSILANIASSGIGGALLIVIVGNIKNFLTCRH